jgi:hypothetical protein
MDILVELGAGGEVIQVIPDAAVVPPSHVRASADPEMLKRVGSFAFLSVVAGALVFDEAGQAAELVQKRAAVDALAEDAVYKQLVANLRDATPAQITAWVDAQVTDLASARTMFKRILVLLAWLLRR